METKRIVQSQVLASLKMLEEAIIKCPESIWFDPSPKNRFWHVAYHAVFYTHLYLQPSESDFFPWEKHLEGIASLDDLQETPEIEPYTKDEVLWYLSFCREQVKAILPRLDLHGEDSGFHWLPFSKLELQFYNIRHLQQHIGELCERLGREAGVDVSWEGTVQP
jgi:hypothetical protein